jgi:hypothetical protein
MENLKYILEKFLDKYNKMNTAMDLILLEDAIFHVAKTTYIIDKPKGHVLLILFKDDKKQKIIFFFFFFFFYSNNNNKIDYLFDIKFYNLKKLTIITILIFIFIFFRFIHIELGIVTRNTNTS